MSTEHIIEIEDLSFSFGATPVLVNVSLRIERGDFVCIVGPNGGGKTTLLRLVLGLLEPDGGRIRVLGQPPREACRRIGYMPQYVQLDPLFPVRVSDVALMGRLGSGHRFGPFGRADRAKAAAALEGVGLSGLADRPFAALSGGQRQRVLIARALVSDPEMLLLDEPTANLDPMMQDDITEVLRELNERLTVVVVSHDVGFVARQVRTVVCVNREVAVHSAAEVTGDAIRDLYGHGLQLVHHRHAHRHGGGT